MVSGYTHLEQDVAASDTNGDDLPTYDDLAQQNGPNSRFGRWRGWIEKRSYQLLSFRPPICTNDLLVLPNGIMISQRKTVLDGEKGDGIYSRPRSRKALKGSH
jgi:hypothetical protein